MTDTSTLLTTRPAPAGPSGAASLHVRERYLRRRSHRRGLGDRGAAGLWLVVAATVSWLFVVGFATLGH